ncbi:MAG: glycosyltransferase [Lachnospiraceae bacterium]|nr:glycosyltransferase [Lachnospiraceae bacterium]
MRPLFSILVVCLNPGEKLKRTLESVLGQCFGDYEIIIKDGGSSDGSLSCLEELAEEKRSRIRTVVRTDRGIYDAMNQAAGEAVGKYVYFLNCGDVFAGEGVLFQMAKLIEENPSKQGVYYGNIYERKTGQVVASNPHLDAFGCYRNVPCHQACFYDRRLLLVHPFEIGYRVRSDYEQFLWCFFQKELRERVQFTYGEILIADYEGGGFSETRENREISTREHGEIVSKYMSKGQIRRYRAILWLTLAPWRTRLAQDRRTAGLYNGIKSLLYRIRKG